MEDFFKYIVGPFLMAMGVTFLILLAMIGIEKYNKTLDQSHRQLIRQEATALLQYHNLISNNK